MKTGIRPDNMSRREFLKNLPRQLVDGIRSITTAMSLSATEMADPSSGGRDSVPCEVEAILSFPRPPNRAAGPSFFVAEKRESRSPILRQAQDGERSRTIKTFGDDTSCQIASGTSYPRNDGRAVSKPRVARLDVTRCLAWGGASCQLCYLACHDRDQALEMHDQKPVVIASVCDGCAMCVVACRTVNDFPALEIVPATFKEGKIMDIGGGLP